MKKFFLFMGALIGCTMMNTSRSIAQEVSDSLITISNQLDTIEIVVAPLRPITGNLTHLKAEDLNLDNAGQNLPYLLQIQPALVATSDDGLGIGYTYFRIRGTDHTRINMTVNGVPLNEAETQTVYWVNISDMARQINHLEIQRGIGTSQNGSASFGASINMETPREVIIDSTHQYVTGAVGFNGGMYNTFREWVNIQSKIGHWSIRGRFTKVNSDGYIERAKSDLYSYFGYIGYSNEKRQIDLTAFGGHETTYMAWYGINKEQLKQNRRFNPAGLYLQANGDTAYYPNQTDNYSQQHFHLRYTEKINSNWTLDAVLHYLHDQGYYEQYNVNQEFTHFGLPTYIHKDAEQTNSDIIDQKHMQNHFYGGLINAHYNSQFLNAQMGFSANQNRGDQWGNVVGIQDSLYPILVRDKEYYRSLGVKTETNIFAKINWHILKREQEDLMLYVDAQYRFIDYTISGLSESSQTPIDLHEQFHFFNPKTGISYTNHGHLTYFTFAMANREPSRSNYIENGENQSPKPERLFDYELGYQYRGCKWYACINFYAMDYYNQLVLTGQQSQITGGYLTTNVPRSYRIGIELNGKIQITNWFGWEGNITLSRNKILHFTDYVDVYDSDWNWLRQDAIHFKNTDIAFSPAITAGSLLSFNIKGLTARIQTIVVGQQYLDNSMSKEAMLKAYTTTNLNLQYILPIKNWWGKIRLLAQLNNLFNSQYESNGGNYLSIINGEKIYSPWYFPQAGINVHAGFILDL